MEADPFEMEDSSEDDVANDGKQQQPQKTAKAAGKKATEQQEAEHNQPKVAAKNAGKGRSR